MPTIGKSKARAVRMVRALRVELGTSRGTVKRVADQLGYGTAFKSREPSARALRDAMLMPLILTIWTVNYKVYGIRKMWKALARAGHQVGRDQVARLMRQLDISVVGGNLFADLLLFSGGRLPGVIHPALEQIE